MYKVLFLVLATFYSCLPQNSDATSQPNILWISSEDNSKHYLELFDPLGVETPNIKELADHGIRFTRAFSNAPVCSVARSTLISSCYAPRVGVQFHRKLQKVDLPAGLKMFPAYLKDAGYYTSNNSKEDYNFNKPENVWDDSSKTATWKNRSTNQAFFHVQNIGTTHESSLHFSREKMKDYDLQNPLDSKTVFPVHPDTDIFRYTNAYYRDRIQQMDAQLGDIITDLKADDLFKNTIIFYFGDHGGVLPGSKGYIYETGLHIPLVVYIPEKYQHLVDQEVGSTSDEFVSFIDFGPSVLALAGIEIPSAVDGKPFLGKSSQEKGTNKTDQVFCYADRFDEKYDLTRSVRKGKYKYIRNYNPFYFDGVMNNYRYKQLAFTEWWDLYKQGKLNDVQSQFFQTRDAEQLFDLEKDPYETTNLAVSESHQKTLSGLRELLTDELKSWPDLSFYPEHYLIQHAFDDPVKFGQAHIEDISRYIDICNQVYALNDDNDKNKEKAIQTLTQALQSEDPWDRFWAINTLGHFGRIDALVPVLQNIAQQDSELINRVRVAEYLGHHNIINPTEIMSESLYNSTDGTEALSILGSIVLMQDGDNRYTFNLNKEKIPSLVFENTQAQRRLLYLNLTDEN